MLCPKCNANLVNSTTHCPQCGAEINYSGNNEAPIQNNVTIDNPSHFAGAVSCCFPIVGLILYFVWKDEKPNSAKVICYWMIGGIVIWVVLYALLFIVGLASTTLYY